MKKIKLFPFLLLWLSFSGILVGKNDFLLKFADKQIILPLYNINNQEYTSAKDFFPAIGGEVKEVKETNALLISLKNKSIILSNDTNYFAIEGQLIQLCCLVVEKDKKWLIPLELLKKIAEIVYNLNYFWNPEDSLMIWGYEENKLLKIRIENTDDSEKIFFEGNFGSEYTITEEEGKVYFLFFSKDIIKPYFSLVVNDEFIKNMQYQLLNNKGYYVVNLQSSDVVYRVYESKKGRTLIMEFPKIKKKEASTEAFKKQEKETPEKEETSEKGNIVSIVVIDPGHGGEETGAIGPKGSYEKDITLSISKKIKKLLEEKLGLKVFLTRNQDMTLSLIDRTAMANNLKADIFISIHANASYRKIATGAETYYLSLEATDEEAYAVAKEENKLLQNGNENLNMILWDLVQTQHLQESSQLAEIIQEELNNDLNIKNRGVKQAPFRVLMGANMPAVLIEIGFITNPKEEELLNDDNYQLMLSNAIIRSIQRFIKLRQQRFGTVVNQ